MADLWGDDIEGKAVARVFFDSSLNASCNVAGYERAQ